MGTLISAILLLGIAIALIRGALRLPEAPRPKAPVRQKDVANDDGIIEVWRPTLRAREPLPAKPVTHARAVPNRSVLRRVDRGIVLDCETTGLSPAYGHRIVSLAAIEVIRGDPTGRAVNLVFNPGRKSDRAARRVHGLSDALLALQRPFKIYAQEIRDFIGDDTIIGHNIRFDISFLSVEMRLCGLDLKAERPLCTMEAFAQMKVMLSFTNPTARGRVRTGNQAGGVRWRVGVAGRPVLLGWGCP